MRKFKIGLVSLILFAVCGVPAARANVLPVPAMASYSARLRVNLTFPVIVGLGVASLHDAFLPPATCLTMGIAATTACTNPTSAFMNNVLTFTAGPVAGSAGPGTGFASGVSFGTSETIVLINRSGGAVMVPLSGTYSYSLTTTAAGQASAGAAVSFQIDETMGGMTTTVFGPQPFAIVSPPNANMSATNAAIPVFNIAIPNGATADINIDPFASGDAKAVPEPSALIPLVTLVTAGWLKRKWFRASK